VRVQGFLGVETLSRVWGSRFQGLGIGFRHVTFERSKLSVEVEMSGNEERIRTKYDAAKRKVLAINTVSANYRVNSTGRRWRL